MELLELVQLLTASGALVVAALGSIVMVKVLREPGNPVDQLKQRLGELAAENEKLAKELLEAQRAALEAKKQLEQVKAELELKCKEEKEKLVQEYEKKIEELANTSKAALSLYEAVKAGAVTLTAEGCDDVLLHVDGEILCRKGKELEVIWPRR